MAGTWDTTPAQAVCATIACTSSCVGCPWHPDPVTTVAVARFVVPRVTQPISVVIYLHRCLPNFFLLQNVLRTSLPVLRFLTLQFTIDYTHPSDSRDWVVDSGASHHVTTNLATFSLHEPYFGSESVFIGDGKCLYHYISLIWLLFSGAGSSHGGTSGSHGTQNLCLLMANSQVHFSPFWVLIISPRNQLNSAQLSVLPLRPNIARLH